MAGASFTVTVDTAALRTGLAQRIKKLQDPTPILRDIGEYLVRATDRRFRAEQAPDGTPWAPNSEVTLARALGAGGGLTKRRTKTGQRTLTKAAERKLANKKILRASGALQDTIRYQLAEGGRAVAVGTDRVYGAMQQFGGRRAQYPHLWGDIPARPFLGVSDADRAEIAAIVRRHLS